MNQVLLLTTNLSADIQVKDNLEYLGYEVLCSTQLVEQLMVAESPLVFNFPIVIFSETLTNEMVDTILQKGQVAGRVLLRCDRGTLNEELAYSWQRLGLTAEFSVDTPLSNLRELLSTSRQLTFKEIKARQPDGTIASYDSFMIAMSSLSSKERRLFEILTNEKGAFLTRKEVAKKIWNEQATSSNLAQLSQIVSRIRLKFAKYGFTEQSIETHWKKGYKVSASLLKFSDLQ